MVMYMNEKKMGKFIKELREEKGYTQQYLADQIHVSRQTISKWEIGKSICDSANIKLLSDLFEVSPNEIINGEKNKENDITLKLYDENIKMNKKFLVTFIVLILVILAYFVYYFINQYNSISIYTMYSKNESHIINNGILVKTKDKIYFNLGYIEPFFDYDTIEIYYKIDDTKNIVLQTTSSSVYFYDFKGNEEYIEFKNFDEIINNMYVEMCNDKCETFKLNLTEDYKNNNIFFQNKGVPNKENENNKYLSDNDSLIENIKDKFSKKNDGYFKEVLMNNNIIYITYFESSNTIIMEKFKKNIVIEEWNYDLTYNILNYRNNINSFELEYTSFDDFNCVSGECNTTNEYEIFFEILQKELK